MPNFTKLNASNYPTWSGEMQAYHRSQGVWRIVSGDSKQPTLSSTPTDAQEAALEAWQLKSDKAAGYIYLAVEDNQKVHFANIAGQSSEDVDCPGLYTPPEASRGSFQRL